MGPKSTTPPSELALRIIFLDPVPEVAFSLARKSDSLVPPARAADGSLVFDLTVRLGKDQPDGSPNFLGPFTHGPPAKRFLDFPSGTLAGQSDSCWTRAAKVNLSAITWRLIRSAWKVPGFVLEARFAGRARDGGPACATLKPLAPGWKVARAGAPPRG
jgi:hypothetical protein